MSSACQSTHSESECPCLEVGTNWWDTCIFELNEPGFIQSLILSRSDPVEAQSLIWQMSGWGYSTVRLSTPIGGITAIWQWQWCLNADSGSTNWTPNAACMAEKRTQAGLSEFHHICEPFSRFIVCSLIKAQWTAAMFTCAVECLIKWISVVFFNNVDLGKTGPANSKVMPK